MARGRHTPEEDQRFPLGPVAGPIWGAYHGDALAGVMALRPGWIDQLYVLAAHQGQELGPRCSAWPSAPARRSNSGPFSEPGGAALYERQHFTAVEFSDGARNENASRTSATAGMVGGDGFEPPALSV